MLHKTPEFYCVYILQSIPKPRTFYIGSTPDIHRRIRQHNGDLKAGGAFKTKRNGSRPWKVVVIVYNFPSRIAALQFEHSLQHPQLTRRIAEDKRVSKNHGVSIHQRLANVKLLVNSCAFSKMDLRVRAFQQSVLDVWKCNRYNIIFDGEVEFSEFDEFKSQGVDDFDEIKEKILNEDVKCCVCNDGIDMFKDVPDLSSRHELQEFLQEFRLIGLCYHNKSTFHLTCLARTQNQNQIIPTNVECPCCTQQLTWSRIVKTSTKLRHYLLKGNIITQPTQDINYNSS